MRKSRLVRKVLDGRKYFHLAVHLGGVKRTSFFQLPAETQATVRELDELLYARKERMKEEITKNIWMWVPWYHTRYPDPYSGKPKIPAGYFSLADADSHVRALEVSAELAEEASAEAWAEAQLLAAQAERFRAACYRHGLPVGNFHVIQDLEDRAEDLRSDSRDHDDWATSRRQMADMVASAADEWRQAEKLESAAEVAEWRGWYDAPSRAPRRKFDR